MVFFTCNTCGESLKKKDVEKHTNMRCRGGPNLTCVDCLKDFRDDYVKHTVCVSEDQRYSAKGLNGAPAKSKQQMWVETAHEALGRAIDDGLPGITNSIRQLMLWLQEQATMPDKGKPFTNYIKNARRGEPAQNIDFVWKVLDKARQDLQVTLQAEREAEKKAKEEQKKLKMAEGRKESSSEDFDSSDEENDKKTKKSVESEPSDDGSSAKANGKKDKKKKRMVSESESVVNGTSEFRKTKKSKKDPELDEGEESGQLNSAFDACHLSVEQNVDDLKLSKKERKEKKKKEKYEAEMKSMESAPTTDEAMSQEEPQETAVEETEDKKSKKKKNKKGKDVVEAAVEEEAAGEKRKKKEKKGKKNKGREDDAEPMDTAVLETKTSNGKSNTCKLNETLNMEDLGSSKFSFETAIMEVLESQSDHEITLKKLTKKVMNGYLASLGEDYSQEEEIRASNKFHKKLHKMHNVLLHKERVKLKTSRD